MNSHASPSVFVTGATSHCGCHLLERLIKDDVSFRCLIRSDHKESLLPRGNYQKIHSDLQRTQEVAAAARGAQAILHLAHIRNAPLIVDICKQSNIRRLIVISSTRKFTRFPDESSRAVEQGEKAIRESGLDWTILRPSMIYGDSRDSNIADLIEAVQRQSFFPLIDGGKSLMQPVFAPDLVDAMLQALARPATIGREYNIAGPQPISLRRMLELIREMTNSKVRFVPIPGAPALLAARVLDMLKGRSGAHSLTAKIRRLGEDKTFDIADAQRDLDFSPRPFEDCLRQKLEWRHSGR